MPTWLVAPWPRGRERAEIKVRSLTEPIIIHSVLVWTIAFTFWRTLTLKQVDTGESSVSKERGKTAKRIKSLPHMSHPPASLQCTVHSRCMGSALGSCSFFQPCSLLSGRQCSLVCKAHSGKIPTRDKGEMLSQSWAKIICLHSVPGSSITTHSSLLTCVSHNLLCMLGNLPPGGKLQLDTQPLENQDWRWRRQDGDFPAPP